MSLKSWTFTLSLLSWAAVWPVAAQTPASDPFVVNTTTDGDQGAPDVAVGADGSFAVVWISREQDGSGWGIFARWFDPDGAALTSEVAVNVFTNGDQVGPRIDRDAQGRFVIVWEDTARGIFARRFDHAGQALSDEFEIITSVHASEGAVSVNASGGFVVAWLRAAPHDSLVEARRYGSDGLALGSAFAVAPLDMLSGEEETAVELRDNGSFLVVWSSSEEVFARRFDPAGDPVDDGVQLSEFDPTLFRSIDLDAGSDDAGHYRVFWATNVNLEEFVSMTRTVSGSGELGSLTNLGHPSCRLPGFSMTGNGDFVVTQNIESLGLEGIRHDRNGVVLSTFVIESTASFNNSGARLAHRGPDSRELVAVWARPASPAFGWDVKARVFRDGIFTDGFESGDAARWSTSIP